MKKLILILVLIPSLAYSGELPNWVYQSATKDGDVWRYWVYPLRAKRDARMAAELSLSGTAGLYRK